MRFLVSAVLLWLSAAAAAEEETVSVQLLQGVIEGSRSEAKGGKSFYSFQGIPYAEPPVGSLRFKDPLPAGAWEGVRNGTVAPPLCPQPDAPSDWMQEDCLYLSVFTPQPNRTDLPVMVWLPKEASSATRRPCSSRSSSWRRTWSSSSCSTASASWDSCRPRTPSSLATWG
nr:esterase SG1-like [Penaeus vannamei]